MTTDEEILRKCLGTQRTLGDMLHLAVKLAREDAMKCRSCGTELGMFCEKCEE